jgi:lipopolysaccharide heptosyltransferase II
MPLPSLSQLDARRIALIKPSALGDIIHALPVLHALRCRFPSARITWIVNRGYAPLLQGHPDLDETLPFDRKTGLPGLLGRVRSLAGFVGQLRERSFDLVLDLQGLLRSGLMCLATGAPRRVGPAWAREGAGWFYTDRVGAANDFRELHAVDRYRRVVEALGVGHLPKEFRLPVAPEAREWALDQLRDLPRPWLMLGVGSRWLTKRWLPAHFADLAARAQKAFGGTAVFLGGPDEAHLSAAVRERLTGRTLDLTGRTTLPQLVAILACADVMLANDTGPLHVAVALGRPVVAPYTCTRVPWTGPYGQFAQAVETTVWCRGSCRKRCSRMECMTELTPDRLWPVLEEVLQTWQTTSRFPPAA